jgi:hypothetical protein
MLFLLYHVWWYLFLFFWVVEFVIENWDGLLYILFLIFLIGFIFSYSQLEGETHSWVSFFFFFGGGLFLALAISQLNYRIWSCILRQTCNNKWESSGSWVLVSELVFFLLFIILLNDLVPILIKFQSSNSDLK